MVDRITFEDLVERYGDVMAYDLLLSFEKLAKIDGDIAHLTEGTRFQRAIDALTKISSIH